MNEIIKNYLDAFTAANPDREMPTLIYERGWFRLTTYDAMGISYPSVHRKTSILNMTQVLRNRVAKGVSSEEALDNLITKLDNLITKVVSENKG